MKLFDSIRQNISRQKKFEENILHYIVGRMKPLSTVDDPNFLKIFVDNFFSNSKVNMKPQKLITYCII